MTPVRVLVVDQAVGVWGAQLVMLRLAAPLAQQGVQLVLAAPPGSELAAAWSAAGFETVTFGTAVGTDPRTDGQLSARGLATTVTRGLADIVRLARLARENNIDVIHANGHAVHLSSAVAARLARTPVLLHLHEEMPFRLGRAVRASAVAVAGHAIAVSRAVRLGVPGVLRSRVRVLYNGIDLSSFDVTVPRRDEIRAAIRSELGISDTDLVFITVTRLDPAKRVGDVLDSLGVLAGRERWRAVVVGQTSSFAGYAQALQLESKEKFGDRVIFTGRREDVAQLLIASDVMVHTGVVEGLPLALVEAQAAGLPVLAYRVAGIPEIVEDGITGVLCAPADSVQLGASVATIAEDLVLRTRLSQAAAESVRASFDLGQQVSGYVDLLQKVL